MGQSIATRIEVRGTLVCLGPVHVGGWDNTAEANLTVAHDGTGQPCLPGTSIAGALRAYLGGIGRFNGDKPGKLIDALFGYITPGGRDGSPSWIRVDDAHLIGTDPVLVVRDGVGIDRHSASAAANYLYTRQLLPAGTRFALRLVADTPTAAAVPDYPGGWPVLVHDAVDAMIAGLTQSRVPIGAGRVRGYGRVELRDVTIRRADLSDHKGLIAWLTDAAPARPPEPAKGDSAADGRLRITITWRPVSPLLVRDSLPGAVVDTLPLTATDTDGTIRLLLPGSSIRGAARAHAERIVRTLRRRDAPARFDETLCDPPPGVDVLFGSAPTGDPAGSGKGRRGVLTIADCHSVGVITADQWHGIITTRPDLADQSGAEEREKREQRNIQRDQARTLLRQRLNEIGASLALEDSDRLALEVSDHVAIDRWTGGAGDHRLFSVLDPDTTVDWEPISADVDVTRLDRQGATHKAGSAAMALPLLLLVLRDLRDGWLSLGYGGTRGRGQIKVTEVTFDGAGLSEPWRSLTGRTLDNVLTDPSAEIVEAMTIWEQTFQEATA